eukprot:TRINITY_DN24798_c0_g1_i4.p2 TRINITY_DN24798_c0_g1~~TRINITY_DN24798_c0_g1_i4.p2  ORF type:complete len:161 (-),score=39.73 TRINITY_DN24798_c0_g1_i4:210-692(-)
MQTLSLPQRIAAEVLRLSQRLDWLAPLAVRLVFGYFWGETGWAKLHNLDAFAGRFAEWGIPFPEFSALSCAVVEFGGGLLMMLGLATRLTMVAMIVNMLVALIVVVLPGISTLDEFVELDEVLYLLVFLWLLIAGPGRASLDAWVLRWLGPPTVGAKAVA